MHTVETRVREMTKRKALRDAWLVENGPCQVCGEDTNLEIDHINPALKIGHTVWSWAPARRLAELAKCQVLCRTCHQQKSIDERTYPSQFHGTNNFYKHGCKCEPCRRAHADVCTEYRLRTGKR